MAFTWGRRNRSQAYSEVVDEHTDVSAAESALLKRRVMDFARFVVSENPDSDWMTANGRLRMWGDLQ